jgi:hypothetical protein
MFWPFSYVKNLLADCRLRVERISVTEAASGAGPDAVDIRSALYTP